MNNICYLIDNMEFMKTVPDKFFDLAIVDPPYGIDAGTMTMGKGSRNDKGKNKLKKWDSNPPDENYFIELFRISKNQIIWGGNYFLDKIKKSTSCMLIWDKMDYNSDFASSELAWTSFDSVVKTFRYARNHGEIKIHPTQKSIKLYKWLLQNYAKPGWTIFDSHVGSGSIRIACHDMGFDFTGCELDADYWRAQEERFKNHIAQSELFENQEIQQGIFVQPEIGE